MFDKNTEQECGFIVHVNTNQEDIVMEGCSKLEDYIESKNIEILKDFEILKDKLKITGNQSENKKRLYIPVKYNSQNNSIDNRKKLRNIVNHDDISIIYNK